MADNIGPDDGQPQNTIDQLFRPTLAAVIREWALAADAPQARGSRRIERADRRIRSLRSSSASSTAGPLLQENNAPNSAFPRNSPATCPRFDQIMNTIRGRDNPASTHGMELRRRKGTPSRNASSGPSREISPTPSPRKRRRILFSEKPKANASQGTNELACATISPKNQSRQRKSSNIHSRSHPSRLPLGGPNPSIFFVSQLLPASFDQLKRFQILQIFRYQATYVPTCVCKVDDRSAPSVFYGSLANNEHCFLECNALVNHIYHGPPEPVEMAPHEAALGSNGKGWPKDQIPVEIFEKVTNYLPRDTAQAMRLVNHEFEKKVSRSLFQTVVVPFRAEIYGMVVAKKQSLTADIAGKGKAREIQVGIEHGYSDDAPYGLYSRQPEASNVDKGMRVFKGWGPHIIHFAMSFEIDEETLNRPPRKGTLELHKSFWGDYVWPYPSYRRFEICAGLEQTADETGCMTIALSHLVNVTELALSVDSGLGYLSGPDISDRAQIFKEKTKVFGARYPVPDAESRDRAQAWKTIARKVSNRMRYLRIDPSADDQENLLRYERQRSEWRNSLISNPAEATELSNGITSWVMQYFEQDGPSSTRFPPAPRSLQRLRPALYSVQEAIESSDTENDDQADGRDDRVMIMQLDLIDMFLTPDEDLATPPLIFEGVDLDKDSGHESFATASLLPGNLTSAQKEWLLETEWAQRAFLSSYILAVMDNSVAFQNVRTFNLAKLSSRYLPLLDRHDLWAALPNLEVLTILVSPDWRDVTKQPAGSIATPSMKPSLASIQFLTLLKNQVAPIESIKSLTLGYIGGGEHATGLHARNRHVPPAPIGFMMKTRAGVGMNITDFPHVEHLSFINTWFTPDVLKALVDTLKLQQLKTLHFDSVSLVAYGGVAFPQSMGAHLQHFVPAPPAPPPSHPGAELRTRSAFGLPQPPPVQIQHALPFGWHHLPQPQHALPLGWQQLPQPQQLWQQPHPAIAPLLPPAATTSLTSTPATFAWLTNDPTKDTWAHLIDAITPSENLTQKRFAQDDEALGPKPDPNPSGSLLRLKFTSCGYVKLPYQFFEIGTQWNIINRPYHAKLYKRFTELLPHMMVSKDDLLGHIIPFMKSEEEDVLVNAFHMRMGWGDDRKKYENREDGQLDGGSGRFSGILEKFTSSEEFS